MANATINDPADAVLTEMDSRQVLQLFRATLALHTFAGRDQRVRQASIVTFKYRLYSQLFLIAGFYLQQVLSA